MKRVVFGGLVLAMLIVMTLPFPGVTVAETEASAGVAPALKPALAIKAPALADVGQKVTIKVVDRHTGKPISRAGVWAINVTNMKSQTDDAEAYASMAKKSGHFLGWTNWRGNVYHRFSEQGRYVLVTAKDGFVPGFDRIAIRPLQP